MFPIIEPFRDLKKTTRIILPDYDKTWQPPRDFPNLSAAKSIAVDTETRDPELTTVGPGWGRGVGEMVGLSIATEDAGWYFPIRHRVQSELNMDVEKVLRWTKDVMAKPIPKIFANAAYDIGWMREEGIAVEGIVYDIMYAEALLDDTARSYSLENISKKYLGEGKESNDLYDWCSRAYGGKPDGKQRANIYRAPPSLVGPYAEIDAINPFKILRKQWKQLEVANLLDVFKLECELIKILVRTRERGIRVSEERAYLAQQQLTKLISEKQRELNKLVGFNMGVRSPQDMAKAYDKFNLDYPHTDKGNPSFLKGWLEVQPDPISGYVFDIRRYTKARDDFLGNYLLKSTTNGRVYPSFHPLRGEGGGAVTGRFSASNPPVQQFPSRDAELTPIIRGCFIPEDGYEWVKADYSAIELRMLAHFSGDQHLIQSYNDNPLLDYHNYVKDILGGKLPRIAVKQLNFSIVYGGGLPTVTKQMRGAFTEQERIALLEGLGLPILSDSAQQLARAFINIYDEEFPAARTLLENSKTIASNSGEMRTILNRRTTFNFWEPANRYGKRALPLSKALYAYGKNIKRAKTKNACNYMLQGSAADLLKSTMVAADKAGLLEKLQFSGSVHDEYILMWHPDLRKEFAEFREIAENSIKFNVPVILECDAGQSWAEAKRQLDLGPRKWLR